MTTVILTSLTASSNIIIYNDVRDDLIVLQLALRCSKLMQIILDSAILHSIGYSDTFNQYLRCKHIIENWVWDVDFDFPTP